MKSKSLLIVFLLTIAFGFISRNEFAPITYKVSAEESTLDWLAKKVTGQHNGKVKIKSGSLIADGKSLTGGEFAIDMTTISVSDLAEGSSGNTKLTGHLKSPDFFDVENHQSAKFVIKTAKKTGQQAKSDKAQEYDIKGTLTIKGISNDISFMAYSKLDAKTATARATIKFDRTKFDVRYGSKTFFGDIGDKAIYDEVEMTVNLKATK